MVESPWYIRKSERGISVGMTGTGKSTLNTDMLCRFRLDYPHCGILIIDSKPRYRASHFLNGTEVTYKDWVKGDWIDDSIVAYGGDSLKSLFAMSNVVILQSLYHDKQDNPGFDRAVDDYATQLFRLSSPKRPTLLLIDELYDILSGTLVGIASKPVLKAIRAGREANMAVIVGTQRPRSIPIPILTEATKYYLFHLDFEEDQKYMRKHGLSIPLTVNPNGHQFIYYRKGSRIEPKIMELKLAS